MGTIILFAVLGMLLAGVAAVLATGALTIGFGVMNVLQARLGVPTANRPAQAA